MDSGTVCCVVDCVPLCCKGPFRVFPVGTHHSSLFAQKQVTVHPGPMPDFWWLLCWYLARLGTHPPNARAGTSCKEGGRRAEQLVCLVKGKISWFVASLYSPGERWGGLSLAEIFDRLNAPNDVPKEALKQAADGGNNVKKKSTVLE